MSSEGQLLGRCAFATVRGLRVYGDGALAALHGFPQVVEFRSRGGEGQLLPRDNEEVLFRRVALYRDDRAGSEGVLDLLGVLTRRQDASRREGYAGVAVAVAHRDLEAYAAALAEARRLIRQVDELMRGGGDSDHGGKQRAAGRSEGCHWRRFRLPERATCLRLHRTSATEADSDLIEEGVRQLAWLDACALSTVLVFPGVRPGSRALDAALLARCRRAKQREIEGLEAGFRAEFERRLAEIELEYQAAHHLRDDQHWQLDGFDQ
ncbi:MAG: hypothetical protein ACLFSI_02445 [Halorhodospira sp.]